jgi:hypothetical protein
MNKAVSADLLPSGGTFMPVSLISLLAFICFSIAAALPAAAESPALSLTLISEHSDQFADEDEEEEEEESGCGSECYPPPG